MLNQMVDGWTIERLMIFDISITEFPLVAGQATYTLGTGGNFNMTRPARIERMSIVVLSNPAQPLELPMEMLNDQQWQTVPVKNISSTIPLYVYDDGAFPNRNLTFYPIPQAAVNIRIYSWIAISQFPDLFTDMTFPPGYLKALRYCLAVDLAPEYGRDIPPAVAVQALLSKGLIKSLNAPKVLSSCDPALNDPEGGAYDWRSDQPVGG